MVRRWLVITLGVCAAAVTVVPSLAFAQPAPLVASPGAVMGQPVRDPVSSDPERGYPLATDDLMAPSPAVPPRTTYQRPPGGDPAGPPIPPESPSVPLLNGVAIPITDAVSRFFRYAPRYGRLNNISSEELKNPDGTPIGIQRFVITGGVTIYVSPGQGKPEVEFATDNAVVWVHGAKVNDITGGFEMGPDNKREVEVYLSGNVIIRTVSQGTQPATQILRAEEIYYDVARNRAIALSADMELSTSKLMDGAHLTGKEIRRLDEENWEVLQGSVFSSKLPSDPGLRIDSPRMTLRQREVNRTNIFGIPYRDFSGNPVKGWERILTIRHEVTRLNDVPVFYFPYLRTDATDPLGPLAGIGFGMDRIFGYQFYSTWDAYKLLALKPPDGHQWRLHLDYLSDRGVGGGSDYYYTLPPSERSITPGQGLVRLYAISDHGPDNVGNRTLPTPTDHPIDRARALWRHQQEIMEGLYFQGQIAYLSDQNFFEQYYKQEFDYGPNQETFAYLTYQHQNLWAGGLVLPKLGQNWMTRTEYFPKLDGAVVGQSFWDLLVYNARADVTYAQLRPSQVFPFPVVPTDQNTNTGRFDLNQEVSLPFTLGPVKLAPYGVLDLADYTEDLQGDNRGRVYGGGGLRSSLPLSHLYEGASSELFNVRGLYHKVMIGTNYYYARTNTPYTALPQLDRLNDDSTDYTYRYIRPAQPGFISGPAGVALATSPLFDIQQYAIRRLVDTNIDTLDNMHVLQADVRQRLQTKRGYPGLEHTVDVFTLDLSASYFPNTNLNYGKSWSFLEYNAQWNVGDRVSALSSGWFDPFEFGARYWNIGLSLDRPDRTNFYIGYRQTDPLNSKAVTASVGYQMSRRYSVNIGASYDFGIQSAMSNTFTLTRTGSDLTFTVGFTYNALVNNFGFQFLVVPNIANALMPGRFSALGTGQALGR